MPDVGGPAGAGRTFYDPLLEELYDHPRARLADLDELVRIAGKLSVARAVPY